MRVKHNPPRTNGEVDAFIAERWRAGHSASDIEDDLDLCGVSLHPRRILAGIRRHVEANSENAVSGKKLPALDATDIALAAMQVLTALMFCGWFVWALW